MPAFFVKTPVTNVMKLAKRSLNRSRCIIQIPSKRIPNAQDEQKPPVSSPKYRITGGKLLQFVGFYGLNQPATFQIQQQ